MHMYVCILFVYLEYIREFSKDCLTLKKIGRKELFVDFKYYDFILIVMIKNNAQAYVSKDICENLNRLVTKASLLLIAFIRLQHNTFCTI
jgi:trehalose-6-phosphatase